MLEIEFRSELQTSCSSRVPLNLTEGPARYACARCPQIGVIERVEHLQPELRSVPVVRSEVGVLRELQIEVLVIRIVHIAERPGSISDFVRQWYGEDVGIEP